MIGHQIHGEGPVRAIVLHGWFGDSRLFGAVLPALDPEIFCIAMMDYRGYGASADLPGPFDIATIAGDAAGLAEHLGWADYAVIGHSMGGKAALRLAANEGGRVSRILALTPVWAAPGLDAGALAFFRSAVTDVAARAAIIDISTGGLLPETWRRGLAQQSQEMSTIEAFGAYLESWACEDITGDVAALPQEVLAVAGANDGGIPAEMVEANWISGLPNARFAVLPGCGHYPMLETPLALAALIDHFLKAEATG
jgi:pimeloyl-ACP methyl ester carboxylesterase